MSNELQLLKIKEKKKTYYKYYNQANKMNFNTYMDWVHLYTCITSILEILEIISVIKSSTLKITVNLTTESRLETQIPRALTSNHAISSSFSCHFEKHSFCKKNDDEYK